MVTHTKHATHEAPLRAAIPNPQYYSPCHLSPPDFRVSHPVLHVDSVCRVKVERQMLLKAATDIT